MYRKETLSHQIWNESFSCRRILAAKFILIPPVIQQGRLKLVGYHPVEHVGERAIIIQDQIEAKVNECLAEQMRRRYIVEQASFRQ